MNRALLAFGIVTLALVVLVCFVVYKSPHTRSGGIDEPGVEVAVAANDLQAGTRLEEKDIRVVSFPASLVSSNCLRSKSPVVGRVVIFPIQKSECISLHKVAAENAAALGSSLVPFGMRAVSVPVINTVSPAGRVVSGTRVDVAFGGNPTRDHQREATFLENVLVVAVGQRLERNAAGDPETSPVITLLVSPDDAQKLSPVVVNSGRILVIRRNPFGHRRFAPQIDAPMIIPLRNAAFGRTNG